MLKKFLKEVVGSIAGKQAEEIVDLLDSSKYINEFIIAKKMNLTINQARNILYKISDYSLVSSIRKKDKKKGWYTYFWRIEILKSLEFIRNELQKKIKNFESQIKSRESKVFYFCERCNIEHTEENALAYNFTCNECGSVFSIKDNSKFIKDMRRSLDKLRGDLDFIDNEIKHEMEKSEKKKIKQIKEEEKERKEKLRQKKVLREKLKKKEIKKIMSGKKISKKINAKNKKPVNKIGKVKSKKGKNKKK